MIRSFRLILALFWAALAVVPAHAATGRLSFEVDGLTLTGLLTTPNDGEAEALVIIVHGSGETNVLANSSFYTLRTQLARRGVSSFVWDKPGRGESEGEFDINQPVESSAAEVVAAARFLRKRGTPGAKTIGLLGFSRAGWIVPLAMEQDRDLSFWISISGVDAKESFGYLLRTNWALEGYEAERIDRLYQQWLDGNAVIARAGSFKEYLEATKDLRADRFFSGLNPENEDPSLDQYNSFVATTRALGQSVDPGTGLNIYVEGFDAILSRIDAPVLALFGGRDSVVDWRSTLALYADTIGRNPKASLAIRVFPTGNHNLHVSKTGSLKETFKILKRGPKSVPGFYESIFSWLTEIGAARAPDEP